MDFKNVYAVMKEDARREGLLKTEYDPLRGIGCHGERKEMKGPGKEGSSLIPVSMLEDPGYGKAKRTIKGWQKLRCRHDFEYWSARCVKVRDKLTGEQVPFVLNRPQRRVLGVLEEQRLAEEPLRLILLKARQWGGSTLVQMYMAWIQSCHRRNWHSMICAHVKDTAGTIRGMYTNMLESYPEELWEGDQPPRFRPFERSLNIREITGRGCRVTIGSSENQDSVRGNDFAMAHLSETAFWQNTQKRAPEDFIRAVCGSITLQPLTLIAIESTANGVGNYFHSEWLRCKAGKGDKAAVFVPWHEIEIYRRYVIDKASFARSLNEYEKGLWYQGCTLSQIYWYRCKSAEYQSREKMQAEFPSTDTEAFLNTGSGVFSIVEVEELRDGCRAPEFTGSITGSREFVADSQGKLSVWEYPEKGVEYVVSVDVGGRGSRSDWSVVAVMARASADGMRKHRVVAQWRGHIDHDLLAGIAMNLGHAYNEALLIVEANTLETEQLDHNLFVLSRLSREYDNLYRRRSFDVRGQTAGERVGFHTNRSTKPMLIATLVGAIRDGLYEERDNEACNELTTYEQTQNGSYSAKAGYHDDILMTRAMGLFALEMNDSNSSAAGMEEWKPNGRW